MGGDNSDIVLFFGRFHPLILHIPIGFLTLAFVLEVMSRFRRFAHYRPAVGFILFLGAVSASVAAALGFMLAQSGGYNEELLSFHQWSGFGAAITSILASVLYYIARRNRSPLWDRAYLLVMSCMILSLGVTGHFGGSLTHGSDYLTRYMPNTLRRLAGMPVKEKVERRKITDINSAHIYGDIIHPILDTYCTSCHNDDKKKGELMMHTPEYLMKGGESGPAFVPGNADASDMIKRMLLPEDHEDHMPPEGKSQHTPEELELLVWWINEGAPFDKTVAEVNVGSDVQSILDELADPDAHKSVAEKLLDSAVAPVNDVTLASFQQKGVAVSPLADEINWLQADVAPGGSGDSIVHAFASIKEQITWLNLSGTVTTDDGLSALGAFTHLTRLHLGNTAITDEGLKHLSGLSYLESLNLYGTRISDEGLRHLAGMKNLKKLYVWKTHVTDSGVSELKKALPSVQVITGEEISSNG